MLPPPAPLPARKRRLPQILPPIPAIVVGALLVSCGESPPPVPPEDREKAEYFLGAVRDHLDTILAHGRDTYGEPTPQVVDGLEIETLAPVRWTYDDHSWILSNLANQQDLLRTLEGFSRLSGDPTHAEVARETLRHAFSHLDTPNGLLLWGGHTCYDAEGDEWVGRRYHWLGKRRSPIHELKSCYPYYELMWEVDPEFTTRLIRTFWNAHVRHWDHLDFDRHGGVEKSTARDASVWDRAFDEAAPVFFQSRGRTFVHTGSDLYYAGGMLHQLRGEPGALDWAHRLAGRYVATRDPDTGLRGYQYSNLEDVDRAFAQFGDLFPDSHVSEAAIFDPNALPKPLLAQLRLAEKLGAEGRQFLDWTVEDLIAIGRHAYEAESGRMKTLLLDGTDLTRAEMPRDGYFGPQGTSFVAWDSQDYLLCYATAARLSSEPFLWEMVRHIARDSGHGDIGARDGSQPPHLNADSVNARSPHLMAMLELHRATGIRAFLDQAIIIGENILAQRYENGLFTPGPGYRYTRTSRPEPLALLHLAGALLGEREKVPDYTNGHAYFACEQKSSDTSYTFDHLVIYSQRRP